MFMSSGFLTEAIGCQLRRRPANAAFGGRRVQVRAARERENAEETAGLVRRRVCKRWPRLLVVQRRQPSHLAHRERTNESKLKPLKVDTKSLNFAHCFVDVSPREFSAAT